MFRRNRNLNNVPPSIKEEAEKILSGPTKSLGIIIILSTMALYQFSGQLNEWIPFSKLLWLIPLALFLVYVIKISSKVDKSLKEKNTSIAQEYNRYGDSQLFNYATKTGNLKLFDLKKIILMCVVLPINLFALTFGILSLHLVFFKEIKQFLPLGLIAIIVSLGVNFLFLFEDKRIFNEAKRRNQFIDAARKRWEVSKVIYVLMILVSATCAFLLIQNNANFLEKGFITSNGQVIYDGR